MVVNEIGLILTDYSIHPFKGKSSLSVHRESKWERQKMNPNREMMKEESSLL